MEKYNRRSLKKYKKRRFLKKKKKDNDIACISALKALKLFKKIAVCFLTGMQEEAMDVPTCAKWFYYLQGL